MALSIFDLPNDDSGVLPAGKWMLQTQDAINDAFGGMTLVGGLTVEPVDGRTFARACANLAVIGALRVEGDPCELGDVSALKPADEAPALPSPEPESTAEPEAAPSDDVPAADGEQQTFETVIKKGRGK